MMRIRFSFAGAFIFLLLASSYVGFSSLQVEHFINDKVLHVLSFFVLTTCFYWILDTTRRRTLNLTLIVCTGVLGAGSEFLQVFFPNSHPFDPFDIVANIAGSLAAIGLSGWYHKRMQERRRLARQYQSVPGNEGNDLELGGDVVAQESSMLASGTMPSLETGTNNWDEQPAGTDSVEDEGQRTPSASSAGES